MTNTRKKLNETLEIVDEALEVVGGEDGIERIETPEGRTVVIYEEPALEIPKPQTEGPISTTKEMDQQNARETYYMLLQKGQRALTRLLLVSEDMERSDHYEMIARIIKSIGDITKNLTDLQTSTAKKAGQESGGDDNSITNNNLYITTDELQTMIGQKKDESKRIGNISRES